MSFFGAGETRRVGRCRSLSWIRRGLARADFKWKVNVTDYRLERGRQGSAGQRGNYSLGICEYVRCLTSDSSYATPASCGAKAPPPIFAAVSHLFPTASSPCHASHWSTSESVFAKHTFTSRGCVDHSSYKRKYDPNLQTLIFFARSQTHTNLKTRTRF